MNMALIGHHGDLLRSKIKSSFQKRAFNNTWRCRFVSFFLLCGVCLRLPLKTCQRRAPSVRCWFSCLTCFRCSPLTASLITMLGELLKLHSACKCWHFIDSKVFLDPTLALQLLISCQVQESCSFILFIYRFFCVTGKISLFFQLSVITAY